jgi:hypothetical protein
MALSRELSFFCHIFQLLQSRVPNCRGGAFVPHTPDKWMIAAFALGGALFVLAVPWLLNRYAHPPIVAGAGDFHEITAQQLERDVRVRVPVGSNRTFVDRRRSWRRVRPNASMRIVRFFSGFLLPVAVC